MSDIEHFKEYFIDNYINYLIVYGNLTKVIFEFTDEVYKNVIEPSLEFYKGTEGYYAYLNEMESMETPRVVIKDFDTFIELLFTLYNKLKELDVDCPEENLIGYILLRATANDLNDIELFLRRQLEMMDMSDFIDLLEGSDIGSFSFFGDESVSAVVKSSESFNENSYEMKFKVDSTTLPVVRFGVYPDDYWYPNICNNGNSVANTVRVKISFDNIAFSTDVDNYSIVGGRNGIGGYNGLVYDIPNSILPGDYTYLPSIDFSKAYLDDKDINSDKMTISIYSENSKKIEYSYNILFKDMSDDDKDILGDEE